MLRIRQSCDRLIFNMGIPIPWKESLYIETGPSSSSTIILIMLDEWVLFLCFIKKFPMSMIPCSTDVCQYFHPFSPQEGNVQTLLPAACLLQLAEIQDVCCEFLKRQLDPSNCLGIRAFADTHACRDLLRIADKFTQHNFQVGDNGSRRSVLISSLFNALGLWQHGCHFANNVLKCILLNENVWILLNISLKFVPNNQINNIPALVHIWLGANQAISNYEPMMVSLPRHICFTQPQWVKDGHILSSYLHNGIFPMMVSGIVILKWGPKSCLVCGKLQIKLLSSCITETNMTGFVTENKSCRCT